MLLPAICLVLGFATGLVLLFPVGWWIGRKSTNGTARGLAKLNFIFLAVTAVILLLILAIWVIYIVFFIALIFLSLLFA